MLWAHDLRVYFIVVAYALSSVLNILERLLDTDMGSLLDTNIPDPQSVKAQCNHSTEICQRAYAM